jgi:hypothetical protein
MADETRKALAPQASESSSVSILSGAHGREGVTLQTVSPGGPDAALPHKDEGSGVPAPSAKPRTISQRKLEANRRNAKKSTGPRSARGKAFSRCNGTKHGLCSQATLFRPDGKPIDPQLQAVWESLREEYGQDAGAHQPPVQAVVVEWSHQRRATELEESYFQNSLDDSTSTVSLRNLQRYLTTSRRGLLKNVGLLRKLAPSMPRTG